MSWGLYMLLFSAGILLMVALENPYPSKRGKQMGFFSWQCKGCGRSLLSPYAVGPQDDFNWMTQVVVLMPGGSILRGEYDGYGRVNGADISYEPEEPECYHERCWEAAGKPTEYSSPSNHAHDQGYFLDGDDYHGAQPGVPLERGHPRHAVLHNYDED